MPKPVCSWRPDSSRCCHLIWWISEAFQAPASCYHLAPRPICKYVLCLNYPLRFPVSSPLHCSSSSWNYDYLTITKVGQIYDDTLQRPGVLDGSNRDPELFQSGVRRDDDTTIIARVQHPRMGHS